MSRTFIYIYTNEDNIIQEIHNQQIKSKFIKNKVPINDILNDFMIEFNKNNKKTTCMLRYTEGNFSISPVMVIYYFYDTLSIKAVSPSYNAEFDKDQDLRKGYLEITEDFRKTFPSVVLRKHRIKKEAPFLILEEKPVQQGRNIHLLKNHKTIISNIDPHALLTYNRKKQELTITRLRELGLTNLFFTKKNDSTEFYCEIRTTYDKIKQKYKNIDLPQEYDIYIFRDEQLVFEIKEI